MAAGILNSLAIDPTLGNLAALAGIVVVRTFRSVSLDAEINGRRPWEGTRPARLPRGGLRQGIRGAGRDAAGAVPKRKEDDMNGTSRIRVAVNGYGVIGKRVADGVACQDDMVLAGVADIDTDWRPRMATRKGYRLFGAAPEHADAMRQAGMAIAGTLEDLLGEADVVVDCTPKRVAAKNAELYRRRSIKFILQGGETHAATGHSFVAEANYASAVGRDSTRVVSCNTTSIVRTLTALKQAGLLRRARGTLLRRATDPWESHLGGIMNTLVPEAEIPSHQGPDAQSVDPELDVVTMAVKVPETLAHLHYWTVQLAKPARLREAMRLPVRNGIG